MRRTASILALLAMLINCVAICRGGIACGGDAGVETTPSSCCHGRDGHSGQDPILILGGTDDAANHEGSHHQGCGPERPLKQGRTEDPSARTSKPGAPDEPGNALQDWLTFAARVCGTLLGTEPTGVDIVSSDFVSTEARLRAEPARTLRSIRMLV